MDTVQEVMLRDVVTVSGDPTIFEVIKVIGDKKVGCVIVIDGENRPIGIVTEKDIVRKAVYKEVDLKKERISTIMAMPVITVTPDVNVFYASRLMQEHDFRRLPVTVNKKLIGLVTESLLAKYFTQQRKEFYKKASPELANMF